MEELATGAQLQYDVIVLFRFGEVDQADDIGMVQLAHDLNFFEDVGSLEKTVTSAHVKSSQSYTFRLW